MGTLIGLMNLSRTALEADQTAINTTANNVANQNTVGYTRKTVRFTATDSVSLNSFQGNGQGVAATVTSQRNRVLEQRLQQQTSTSASSTARANALSSVEAAFGLSASGANASSTALGSSIDSFFASLSTLSANPSDTATRSAVLSAAATLADAFNSSAAAISNQTAQLNSQIETAAAQIDGLTNTIARLNSQITSLSPGADAGTLEDQRQSTIQQLSGLLGVNQITTENNGVTLTTSSGAVLVAGSQAYSVSTTQIAGTTQLVAGDPPAVQAQIDGGSIGGMMEVRDVELPAMLQQLNALASGVGNAVNTQNAAGFTASGSAGGAIFSGTSSAATISVALASTAGIATAGAGEGAAGTTNALALARLGSAAVAGGDTASNFFSNFIGALGTITSAASSADTADSAALTQAQSLRDSYSAVSLDDEASALTQYQRSYQAAAKLFSIINEIFATALNLGQSTTVS